MSLGSLPPVSFLDADPRVVEERLFSTYEQVSGRTLHPGDPVRLFLEAVALEISLTRQEADWSARQNLLAYATGPLLDHLGALVGAARLPARAARTTVRFSVSGPLAFAVTVPAGTRVTPDNKLLFATLSPAVIPSGALHVDVSAECLTLGAAGNGYVAGQISRFVDPVAWIAGAANLTTSLGGADPEADEPYRDRINLAPEHFSVAGPDGAYAFWARSAHQDIVDVAVVSPAPVEVLIHPLLVDGGIPGQEILDLVEQAVNARDVRPLTDLVTVLPPNAVTCDVDLTWWLGRDSAAVTEIVQTRVEQAVTGYLSWQRARLGRDINPDELVRRMREAGAKRVEIRSPVFTALARHEVATSGERTVLFGGVEDE